MLHFTRKVKGLKEEWENTALGQFWCEGGSWQQGWAEPCLPPQFLPFSFLSSMKSGTAGQQQWPRCFLWARKQAMTSCEAHTSGEIPRFPTAEGGRRAGNDGNCVWQDILKRWKDRETFLLVRLSGLCNSWRPANYTQIRKPSLFSASLRH